MKILTPWLVKQLVGDERALTGTAKTVFCEHYEKTLFGGVCVPNISDTKDGGWHLAEGSIILIPHKIYDWKEGMCGWTIEDLICNGGLSSENWELQQEKP